MTEPSALDGLALRDIDKRFGGTQALCGARLHAAPGAVHALLGENGAGKSTLLSIVAGLLAPDAGTMSLAGRTYRPRSAAEASRAGVAFVPQEPALADALNVAENIVLGAEPRGRFGLVRVRARDELARAALEPLGLDIDVRRPASTLTPAERQIVCIARALFRAETTAGLAATRVVILDEPTSSLAAAEAEHVLRAVRALATGARRDVVLYVSHQLEEIRKVADACTILRGGETVHEGPMAALSIRELATLLLGSANQSAREAPGERIDSSGGSIRPPCAPRPPDSAAPDAEVLLEVKDLRGLRLPRGASLTLHRGEILGIAGLNGSGRTELARAVFGLDKVVSGSIRVRHFEGATSPRERLAQGIGMASEDRKHEGLALALDVAENATMSHLDPFLRFGLLSPTAQDRAAISLIERLAIRAGGPRATVSSLSGGNQQKVALARLLHHDVDVFILDEPTRGIDIGSREQIYELMRELARSGKAVLWISSQASELLAVSHRIAIMRRGLLGPARDAGGLDEHTLLEEAAAS
ncbi:MAG: sugar ABC transporter ATP-binding protein [Polyangiaceae bacterium]